MKTILIGIISGVVTVAVAMTQGNATTQSSTQAQPPQSAVTPKPAAPVTKIAPGSVIPVSLTKTIDAKRVKTGDAVEAKVTQDMKSANGEVIVAKDTKMVGRVTEAQARSKEQKESQVGIEFDRAVMKNGTQIPMPMSIQAIIGQENNNPQNAQSNDGGSAVPTGGGASASPAGGRPSMGGGSSAVPPTATSSGETPSNTQTASSARPQITAKTEGVVGISNLTLTATAANPAQGSVVSSEKNNVKLESGTMMLLRVNQ
ncbi:MAG: hypothetical protein WB919_03775 [Candidatus Sulfotelmatobacter sp.]